MKKAEKQLFFVHLLYRILIIHMLEHSTYFSVYLQRNTCLMSTLCAIDNYSVHLSYIRQILSTFLMTFLDYFCGVAVGGVKVFLSRTEPLSKM
jgi:hypothetical protein